MLHGRHIPGHEATNPILMGSTHKKTAAWLDRAAVFYAGKRLAVLADLIANDATYGRTTHSTQDTASGDYRAGDTAQACTRYSAFLTMAHVVPRGTTAQGQGKNSDSGQFTESC